MACIKSLWLYSKFPPNEPYCLSFHGSGMRARLSCVLWLRVSHEVAIRVSARAVASSEGSSGDGSLPSSVTLAVG